MNDAQPTHTGEPVKPALDREQQLEAAIEHMMDCEATYETAARAAGSAESDYRIKFSDAMLNENNLGTEKIKNAWALKKVEQELRLRDSTKKEEEIAKQKLDDAQTAVTARQTLLGANTKTHKAISGER